jgi:flagellar protein FlbD
MIALTRINDEKFFLNPNLIETIEETPDILITIVNGKKHVVLESFEEITEKIDDYYRKIYMFMPKINTDNNRGRSREDNE